MPIPRNNKLLPNTPSRSRASKRVTRSPRLRPRTPRTPQAMGSQGHKRRRPMRTMPRTHPTRRTLGPRARRQRPNQVQRTRTPRPLQPRRSRPRSTPLTHPQRVGGTPKPAPPRPTAGEVSRGSAGFRVSRMAKEGTMTKGGSRNRSGPPVDPRSGRSDSRGLKFTALPSEGYTGDVPAYDLPDATDREREVWAELWETPQAAAWAAEPWRIRTVAMYCRWSVRSEGDVPAAFLGQVHRLGDQIGLTPAGLRENGWAIAADEVTEKRTTKAAPETKAAPARRLRAVNGGG